MTEPGLSLPERMARVGELHDEADQAMAALRERVAAVREARQAAQQVTGTAVSPDRMIRASTDAGGVVVSLEFAPDLLDGAVSPQRLAASIVETIQDAAARARADLEVALAPAMTEQTAAALTAARAAVPELAELRMPLLPEHDQPDHRRR